MRTSLFTSARFAAPVATLVAVLASLAAHAAFTDLPVTASSSGESHACAISAGAAYCWGRNDMGQLGNNSTVDSATPVAVIGLPSPVTAIAAGQSHSCAVAGATNDVYCWGLNDNFQLGPTVSPNFCGAAANIPCAATAQKASASNTSGATAVAAGWFHTCAVVSGSVKCWGLQGNGRLGDGSFSFATKAASAATVVANTAGATVVTGGSNWSCALVGSVVRCWGGNGSGNLGNNSAIDSAVAVNVVGISAAVGLAGGDSHACAALSSGALLCWGGNAFGQHGNNSTVPSDVPAVVATISSGVAPGPAQVSAGASHTCAVVSGALKCWGRNDFQQSDAVSAATVLVPPSTPRIASGVTAVAAGGQHTCATVGGTLRCFGRNANGQLGTGFGSIAPSALAATPFTEGVTQVASGSVHACAVKAGQVFCWGNNANGQLGNGTTTHSATPVAVSGIASGATAVAAGANHTCAIVNGRVKCWGLNSTGQLGNGGTVSSTTPVDVVTAIGPPAIQLQNVTAIAAGAGHTCAVVTNGANSQVSCWGFNTNGQIGDGTTTSPRTVATPTAGASSAGAIAVAAGNNHSCAIVAGNALKCWGANAAGQLGTTTVGNTTQPAFSASMFSGVTQLAAGTAHNCVVQSGAVRCFGLNSSGQLGNGTTTAAAGTAYTAVASGATGVAAGFGHTCAVVNGAARCWGDGTKGQLGNGTPPASIVATPFPDVAGLPSGVAALSAGSSHTCALVGGGVTCFGFGEFGELGSPRYAYASTPAPVKTGFASATSLLAQQNPVNAGQAVTLVAGIALNVQNPAPGGTVAFRDGGTPIPGCEAVPLSGFTLVRRITCTTSALAAGTRSLTAEYTGDANYAPSGSAPLPLLVQSTTPTAFGFTHQTGVAPGSVATSNTLTIAGINVAVPISIAGGQYSVGCTGTFTTAPGTVTAGATVCVRHVTPLATGATTTSTLTVGSASAPFNSTTALTAAETLPTMAAGISHTLVVTAEGQVWGWGDNTGGKLGNGSTTVSAVPVRAGSLTNVIAVAAGMGHSLALRSDGTVWAWGLGDQGQLGHDNATLANCNVEGQFGTFDCSTTPRQVNGLDNVVAIAAGWRHSMALKRDGTIWTWGSDFYGQRGLGSDLASVPGRVTATGLFTRVSAGYFFSAALRSDGTVWAWGRGAEGELGTASNGTSTPTQVLGFTRPVAAIAAGSAYTLARLDDNTLVAWGANRYGTLGDFTVPTNNGAGVPSFRATPGPVNNLVNVVEFSAGFGFAYARRGDGTVWAWGLNNRGQTGLATTSTTCGRNNNRPCVRDPQRLLTQDGATRLLAGGAHAILGRPGGTIQAYGDNGVGQRGDTTGNFGQPLAPPGNLARFDQSVYDPDFDLTPGGAFGTPSGVGRSSGGGGIDLDDIGSGLSFGPQGLGVPSVPVTVTLTNVADAEALAISSVTAAGSAIAGEFTLAANNCPASLPAGQSCTMDLVFTPAAFGDREGALTIATDAPQSPTITMALSGTGIDTRAPAAVTLGTTASTAAQGVPVTFTATVSAGAVAVTGAVSFLDNGAPIAGCASVSLNGGIANCTTSALAVGLHPVKVSYPGSATVQAAESPVVAQTIISVATPAAIPRLGNISTRMQVLTGNDVLIGGFIIGGLEAKTVVVRARGPSLAPFGIANFLANPKLDLFSGQTVIASNDDFGTAPNLAALQASGFAPSSAAEAAILTTLGPGAYTAVVSGVGNTTGVGIIEVFEVDRPDVPLANISTRGQVLTGNDVMIGGFVIQGDTPQTVVVRARGPSLAAFGIANPLANPVLQLFSGPTPIATNDNWQQAGNAAEIQGRGFAPANALESAILITLNPGAYTAIVTGSGGGTGVGIIEVFAQ